MIQKNSKNVLRQIRPYHSSTNGKGNGKQKLQTRLSRNYDFVFTNLLKKLADLSDFRVKSLFLNKSCSSKYR